MHQPPTTPDTSISNTESPASTFSIHTPRCVSSNTHHAPRLRIDMEHGADEGNEKEFSPMQHDAESASSTVERLDLASCHTRHPTKHSPAHFISKPLQKFVLCTSLMWLFLVLFCEFASFSAFTHMHFTEGKLSLHLTATGAMSPENGKHVLLIADPQLIDEITYGKYPERVARFLMLWNDSYLRRVIGLSMNPLKRSLKIKDEYWLGDYWDNASTTPLRKTLNELIDRYWSIFSQLSPVENRMVVAGNHDVGYQVSTAEKVLWMREAFGLKAWNDYKDYPEEKVRVIALNTLFWVQAPSDHNEEQLLWEFVDRMHNEPPPTDWRTVLIMHIPLWRHRRHECSVPFHARPKIPEARGANYETYIPKEPSQEIITKLNPTLAISGDHHWICDYKHGEEDDQPEFWEYTVPSMSLFSGNRWPGYSVLNLSSLQVTHIQLPPSFILLPVCYGMFWITAVLVFFAVVASLLYRDISSRLKRKTRLPVALCRLFTTVAANFCFLGIMGCAVYGVSLVVGSLLFW